MELKKDKSGLYKFRGKWYRGGEPGKSLIYFTPLFIGLISITLVLGVLIFLALILILIFNLSEENFNPFLKVLKYPIILIMISYILLISFNNFLLILKDLIGENSILQRVIKSFGISFYLISLYLIISIIFSPISFYLLEIKILSKLIGLILLFSSLLFILLFFNFFKIKFKLILNKFQIKNLDDITN